MGAACEVPMTQVVHSRGGLEDDAADEVEGRESGKEAPDWWGKRKRESSDSDASESTKDGEGLERCTVSVLDNVRALCTFSDGSVFDGGFVRCEPRCEPRRERHGMYWRDVAGTGETDRCLPHGQGGLKNADGGVYAGAWAKGKPHGRGVYTYDGCEYDGEWADGMKHGSGVLRYADDRVEELVVHQHGELVRNVAATSGAEHSLSLHVGWVQSKRDLVRCRVRYWDARLGKYAVCVLVDAKDYMQDSFVVELPAGWCVRWHC